MKMTRPWRIELLGGLRARCADQVITRFRTQKAGALLAYLAYHHQRTHPREVLVEVLWPDIEPAAARNNLRVALVSLRHQLEPPGATAGGVILADRASLGLNPLAISTDVIEFEATLQAAAQVQDAGERVQFWGKAVELYQGALLAGFYENWIPVEEQRLEELFFRAVRNLITELEQNRQLERALHYAQHAVTVAPLREEARRELMRLYVAIGELPAALRQYHEFEQLLEKQWGEVPSAATRALAHSISQQAGKSGDWKTARSSQVAKGRVAKKGIESPGTSHLLPLPDASGVLLPNLPRQLNRCFGRAAECASVAALLMAENTCVLTLTGAGGSGKTRLSLEVAWQLTESGSSPAPPVPRRAAPDNVPRIWFVPLADVNDPHLVVDAILSAMQVDRSPQSEPLQQVVSLLNAQGMELHPGVPILLLDNYEQLVPSGVPVVRLLLERVPHLKCLVTSRHRLNVPGEREHLVAPLPIPDMSDIPQQLVQNASVQLLVDRAQSVRADFQVTKANAPDVAKLCRRLDGIPLALELAAARAQTLTVAQMLAHLDQRLDFGGSARYKTEARHQTLRAAIDWSYRLLSPALQCFFARLGIFRGGWTHEAAAAICEAVEAPFVGATLDYLTQLRNCSLVLTQEGTLEMRFHMLETLREYALDQLNAEELANLARRHAAYVVELAETTSRAMAGSQAKSCLDILEREHDNLRAALGWAIEHDVPVGLRLLQALGHFWHVRGYAHEGRLWIERMLAAADKSVAEISPEARAKVLSWDGVLAWSQGEFTTARTLLEKGLVMQRASGNERGIAALLSNLGCVTRDQGDFEAARNHFEEALSLYTTLGMKGGIAEALFGLGNIACNYSQYQQARDYFESSLALYRELDDQRGIAFVLNNLGVVAKHQDDYVTAYRLHEEALQLQQEIGDKAGMGYTYVDLGDVARHQHDYEAARTLYERSLALRREVGDKSGIAHTLMGLAMVAESESERDTARSVYIQALKLFQAIQEKDSTICCLEALARLEMQRGGVSSAKKGAAKGAVVAVLTKHLNNTARLWGATQAWRELINFPLPLDERDDYERYVAQVRSTLGPEKFLVAWAEGSTWIGEQAVSYALEKLQK
ncbi:MAG: tetratricopeptide repeat protein [Abitibacteriaceae bacterium]|nr:tetratricopeptide repeat protein [Abditibacteriaceae bacterium]